jgi:hypothetical protein
MPLSGGGRHRGLRGPRGLGPRHSAKIIEAPWLVNGGHGASLPPRRRRVRCEVVIVITAGAGGTGGSASSSSSSSSAAAAAFVQRSRARWQRREATGTVRGGGGLLLCAHVVSQSVSGSSYWFLGYEYPAYWP